MLIYHGSSEIIEKPVFGKGNINNDYGLGFYCTEDIELAKEWACSQTKYGFANKYELDVSELKILRLNDNGFTVLNWISLLVNNRTLKTRADISKKGIRYLTENFLPDISGYDIIIGYRADDSYFAFARDFLRNTISVNQLAQALKLGGLGEQIVIISQKAFDSLKFVGYEIADGSVYFHKRKVRDNSARSAYLEHHGADFEADDNDLYLRDIVREKVKNNDPRLR